MIDEIKMKRFFNRKKAENISFSKCDKDSNNNINQIQVNHF